MRSIDIITTLGLLAGMSTAALAADVCEQTALLQRESAKFERFEELKASVAACFNIDDPEDRRDCLQEARAAFSESKNLAADQFEARLELCEKLGGGSYDPIIDPEDFNDESDAPNPVDNEYLPFPVGAEWVYMSDTEDGLETITVTVLTDTREIMGVECIAVLDEVFIEEADGRSMPVESTIDWYAQDDDGNVWYFGEISFNFEDGFVANIDGSWLAGVDGAKPGIVMLGDPIGNVGTTYRQEWWLGEAEDAATVLAAGVDVDIELGKFRDCIETFDFLPPEPDAKEHKFYAPGIGFIYETKEGEDETLELVSARGL